MKRVINLLKKTANKIDELQTQDINKYLSMSVDICDLEYRMKALRNARRARLHGQKFL